MNQPLRDRTVVVTRAAEQQGEARRLLEAEGARVLDLPALVIGPPDDWGPLDDALEELEEFHWLVASAPMAFRPWNNGCSDAAAACPDDRRP